MMGLGNRTAVDIRRIMNLFLVVGVIQFMIGGWFISQGVGLITLGIGMIFIALRIEVVVRRVLFDPLPAPENVHYMPPVSDH